VLEERYVIESFDYAPDLHSGDHELFLLKIPLKVQGLTMEEVVEHIPCGPTHKEVYASMDWVDRYMTETSIGSGDIHRMMDIVEPTTYRMIHDNSMIANNM
jgi:hypothetical protein